MKMFNHLRVARVIAATFTLALLIAGCEQDSLDPVKAIGSEDGDVIRTVRSAALADKEPSDDGDVIRTVRSVSFAGAKPSGEVKADTIDIYTEDDLLTFASLVLDEPDTNGLLLANITLTHTWTPIGKDNSASPPAITAYTGTFDGNGRTISGLDVTENTSYAGLFALNNGTIQNLTVAGNVTVTAGKSDIDYVAAVAGYNDINGTIQRVISQVTVNAGDDTVHNIGGIAGFNGYDHYNPDSPHADDPEVYIPGGVIYQCRNDGDVTGGFNKIGGIAGENAYQITECVNTGTITCAKTTTGWPGVGGIAGRNGNNNDATEQGHILNSYNWGTVTDDTKQSSSRDGYGGITGWCNTKSDITNCYTTGQFTQTSGSVSGIKNPIIGRVDSSAGRGINNYSLRGIYAVSTDPILTGTIEDQAYMQSQAFVGDLNGGAQGPYVLNPKPNYYPKLSWEL
jgi:hypothetical protein